LVHRVKICDSLKYVNHIFSDSSINGVAHKYRYRYVYNKFHIYINSQDVSYPIEKPSYGYFKGLKNEYRNSDNNTSPVAELLFSAIDLYFDDKLNELSEQLRNIVQDTAEPEVVDFLGFVTLSFGKYIVVGDFFSRTLALEPRNARSFFHLGLSYHYIGDYFNTIQNFTKKINVEPTSFEYYYLTGFRAVECRFRRCCHIRIGIRRKVGQSLHGTQVNLGLASIRTGDTEKAKAHLEMTSQLNRKFCNAERLLAPLE
jgi:tetratricopeptide (TPR) repeat protein